MGPLDGSGAVTSGRWPSTMPPPSVLRMTANRCGWPAGRNREDADTGSSRGTRIPKEGTGGEKHHRPIIAIAIAPSVRHTGACIPLLSQCPEGLWHLPCWLLRWSAQIICSLLICKEPRQKHLERLHGSWNVFWLSCASQFRSLHPPSPEQANHAPASASTTSTICHHHHRTTSRCLR